MPAINLHNRVGVLSLLCAAWLTATATAAAQLRYAPTEEVLAPGVTAWADSQAGVVYLQDANTATGGLAGSPQPIIGEQIVVDGGYGYPGSPGMQNSTTGTWTPTAYEWQALPDGFIYRSYLAGPRESRLAVVPFYEQDDGWLIDATLGGRIGVLRYGTTEGLFPQGFQIDLEGAAFPRLDPQEEFDLVAADFRAGIPLTWGYGPWRTKLAYYHLSSHLGDEFLLKNPGFPRINYVRDAIVLGQAYYLNPDWRLYAEAAYAFDTDGGAEPWEFQFGVEYSPVSVQGPRGLRGAGPLAGTLTGKIVGAPFMAVHGYLREELNFSGNIVAQAGWQWRNPVDGRNLRFGVHYSNGPSYMFEFFRSFEQQYGLGLWYDF